MQTSAFGSVFFRFGLAAVLVLPEEDGLPGPTFCAGSEGETDRSRLAIEVFSFSVLVVFAILFRHSLW